MKWVTAASLCWKAFVKNDEFSKYLLAEKLSNAVYPTYKFSDFGSLYLKDQEFLQLYESYSGSNYHQLDRMFTLRELAKLVLDLPGDTAECGVYSGRSTHIICQVTRSQNRPHHIFDSFEGLSAPSAEDGRYWKGGDMAFSEAQVRERLAEFPQIVYHKGWIPTRFPDVADRTFRLVHLDVDLYQPTRDALEFFYPRLVPGGVLVCDDYFSEWCPGARKAMDEYSADKKERIVRLPNAQGLIFKK
jgi:O-methyltransferase